VQLCATNVETGETGPLMPSLPDYPRSYDSLEVEFFDNAVLYTSAGGTVSMGDPVVCIISSAAAAGKSKCYWLTNILQHDVDYECVPFVVGQLVQLCVVLTFGAACLCCARGQIHQAVQQLPHALQPGWRCPMDDLQRRRCLSCMCVALVGAVDRVAAPSL